MFQDRADWRRHAVASLYVGRQRVYGHPSTAFARGGTGFACKVTGLVVGERTNGSARYLVALDPRSRFDYSLIDQSINTSGFLFKMPRTSKGTEDRRDQIMDAALTVFARKGFAQASNKEIAHEAGITPGLIYHYFSSKDALLQAIIESRAPVQVIRSIPPEVLGLPPAKFLRHLLTQILEIVEDEKFLQLLRVYLSELLHNAKVSALGIPAIQQGTTYLEHYLRAKIKSGEIRKTDPTLAAQVILGSLMSTVLRRHILKDPVMLAYSRAQIVNATVTLALEGLLPE